MRNALLLMIFVSVGCRGGIIDRSKAVARVNDRTISIEEFQRTLARVGSHPGKDFNSPDGRKELLKEMVDAELLVQQGIKERLPEKSEELRREIARAYLLEKIGREKYEPSDEESRKVFEAKKNELEKVRASHILIVPEKKGDETSERKAKQRAEEILAMLRKAGAKADFDSYARKYSNDPAMKTLGPDLGFFTRDKMVKEFSDAAFALKKIGDLSNVVKTQFGYHVIKLTGSQRGLEELRASIQAGIAQEKQKQRADAFLNQLREAAKIELFDDNLKKIPGVKG
ncbi:MAG: peptidylprolyl isomerase [Pseudomonadota bacterium]